MTVVLLPMLGANFDLASSSFQVPICGFAAKQAAVARKETVRANPRVFAFMRAIESRFLVGVNAFSELNACGSRIFGTKPTRGDLRPLLETRTLRRMKANWR